jgi:hypothetical protein
MERPTARRVLSAALGLGLLADLLLDGPAPGINIPLLVAAVLGAGWLLRRAGRAPDPLDAWLPIAALVLAGFVALRADPLVGGLDVLAAAVLVGASLAAFSGLAVTRRSASVVTTMAAYAIGIVMTGPTKAAVAGKPDASALPRRAPAWVGPVVRGLALGLPLVAIFAVLFASADPIFRKAVDDALGFRLDLGDLPGRVIFVTAVAWFAAGFLTIAAGGIPAVETASLGAAARAVPMRATRLLGSTEAVVVLVVVDLIVGGFVGLQLAYLFGGLDTMAAAGLTYADYARRGYFELVAAACLAGGVIVGLDLNLRRRTLPYLALAVVLVGLTIVMLASAALRLGLYQQAYGWTELRLYVAVSIVALAVTLVALAAVLLTDRTRWLGHAMVVIGVVSLVALNLISPPTFVAQRNLERALDPSLVPPGGQVALDTSYLEVLSDDAIPALVEALPRLGARDAARLHFLLTQRQGELQRDPSNGSVFAWNLARERAKAALATMP